MFFRIKLLGVFIILTILLLLAAQCGNQPTPQAAAPVEPAATDHRDEEHTDEGGKLAPVVLAAGQKLKVVATNSIVADMVSNVGGDLIDLTFLLPLGADPHSFQAAPQDVANVAEAHVLFANGLGLEEFLNELIQNAGSEVTVVSVSKGVETRQMSQSEAAEHAHENEAAGDDDHDEYAADDEHSEGSEDHDHAAGSVDPHTWTSPANAVIFVGNIEQSLSTLDPANAATYQANAAAYQAELQALDTWAQSQIEMIPPENRKLVTDHAVFGYYAARYGLEQVGAVIPSFSTTAEPSAQELAGLEDVVKREGVKAIFVGNTVNPGLEQRVAEDTGVKLVTLYSESLGPAGSGADTYLTYTRYNTTAIVDALK